MAEADEEVVVTIEDDVATADATKTEKTAERTEAKSETKTAAGSDDPLLDLKAQYEEAKLNADRERQGRIAAEQAASAAIQETTAVKTELVETEYATVLAGLEAAQAEAEAAAKEQQAALEAGDFAAASQAQRKVSRAEAKILRQEEAKEALEAKKAEPQKQQVRQQHTDPIEAYVAGRSPQTAQWLRQHTDFIVDPRKNQKLTAAHYNAIGDGLTPDTPEYFDQVERFLGLKEDVKPNGSKQPAKRAAAAPVAPVSQNVTGGGGNANEVRLSRAEAAAATDGTHTWNYDDPSPQKRFKKGDAIGIQEFARRKKLMMAQGAYDRSFSEQ